MSINSVGRQGPASRRIWMTRSSNEFEQTSDLRSRVEEEIIAAVGASHGVKPAEKLEKIGLEKLHTIINAQAISHIRDHVIETLREEFLCLAVAVGRKGLKWTEEFYLDDYIILRINLPYEIARQASPKAENPGIGRVSPGMREIAMARKVINPVFDPSGYHRDHPPAAWAHGPHRDSWAGHSRDGINIWWAISEVPADAGMILFPELSETAIPCDPSSLYVEPGYQLTRPWSIPLKAGEMFIFDPEVLHGTHLNTSGKTRVAVSLRLNANKPRFDPACFYAREFWRRASAIEAGDFEKILHLKREDNLAAKAPPLPIPPKRRPETLLPESESSAGIVVGPSSVIPENGRRFVELNNMLAMLVRTDGLLRAFCAACPHYGRNLADGAIDDTAIFCPGCSVAFDGASGRSVCSNLVLEKLPVMEENGVIILPQTEK